MTTFSAAQRILVTGASSGIGRAIALLLNERGATVLANGRDMERLEQVRTACADPSRMLLAPRDMTADMESLPAWLKGLSRQFGPLHGLVCSAGATWNAPMALYDLAKVRQLFDLCCHAPLLLGGAFCDRRANTGAGAAIVFIAAAAAVAPNPGQGAYGAAKAALVSGAVCLAKEAAPRGVRVNCISPGLVQAGPHDGRYGGATGPVVSGKGTAPLPSWLWQTARCRQHGCLHAFARSIMAYRAKHHARWRPLICNAS